MSFGKLNMEYVKQVLNKSNTKFKVHTGASWQPIAGSRATGCCGVAELTGVGYRTERDVIETIIAERKSGKGLLIHFNNTLGDDDNPGTKAKKLLEKLGFTFQEFYNPVHGNRKLYMATLDIHDLKWRNLLNMKPAQSADQKTTSGATKTAPHTASDAGIGKKPRRDRLGRFIKAK